MGKKNLHFLYLKNKFKKLKYKHNFKNDFIIPLNVEKTLSYFNIVANLKIYKNN
jgi:hypothetical protein